MKAFMVACAVAMVVALSGVDVATAAAATTTTPAPPRLPRNFHGEGTYAAFHQGLATASYVGPEVLIPPLGDGVQARIPLLSGDL